MTFQDDLKTELERAAEAVPHAAPGGIEHIRRRREQRRRVRYTGWALVSLSLVIGILAVNLPDAPTNTPIADSQPVELPEGVVEVPASHPARQLIEEADSYGDFNRQARESLVLGSSVDFWACSLSGVGVCYVIADDIAAIATFDAPPDAVAVVTGPGVDGEVTIPLNTETPLGVESEATAIYVSVRNRLGDELIGVGSDWDSPPTSAP